MNDEDRLDIDDSPVDRKDFQELYSDYDALKARYELTLDELESEIALHAIARDDLDETRALLDEALTVARTIAESARAINIENRKLIDDMHRILQR